MSAARRIAQALIAHASRIFPQARAAWADAMRSEMLLIENDGEALRWALGCLFASYRERVLAMTLMQTRAARVVLAVPIFLVALREFFAPVLTLAYTLHDTWFAGVMGRRMPGDDYRRFIPLIDATPLWLQALWLGSGVAFVFSIWALLRAHRLAFRLFVVGLALELTAVVASTLLEHLVPAYRDAALAASNFATPNFRRDILVPLGQIIFLVLVGAALWQSVGRRPKGA